MDTSGGVRNGIIKCNNTRRDGTDGVAKSTRRDGTGSVATSTRRDMTDGVATLPGVTGLAAWQFPLWHLLRCTPFLAGRRQSEGQLYYKSSIHF